MNWWIAIATRLAHHFDMPDTNCVVPLTAISRMQRRKYAILISLRIIYLVVTAIPFNAFWTALEEPNKGFIFGVSKWSGFYHVEPNH